MKAHTQWVHCFCQPRVELLFCDVSLDNVAYFVLQRYHAWSSHVPFARKIWAESFPWDERRSSSKLRASLRIRTAYLSWNAPRFEFYLYQRCTSLVGLQYPARVRCRRKWDNSWYRELHWRVQFKASEFRLPLCSTERKSLGVYRTRVGYREGEIGWLGVTFTVYLGRIDIYAYACALGHFFEQSDSVSGPFEMLPLVVARGHCQTTRSVTDSDSDCGNSNFLISVLFLFHHPSHRDTPKLWL